jgi:hypothetical protein
LARQKQRPSWRLGRSKSVRLAADKPSLRHPKIPRKKIPLSARHAFVCSLADEIGMALDLIDSQHAKFASLTGTLLVRRIRRRRRRARNVPARAFESAGQRPVERQGFKGPF